MSRFIVTERAMRPAGRGDRRCFYCRQAIGAEHTADCVLISRKVKVRMTVEYEIAVPSTWDQEMIEFHRNESSWCAENAIHELQVLNAAGNCLCGSTNFEFVADAGPPFLSER